MSFTQTFDDFAKNLSTTDIALYAGVALIVWVLFKDNILSIQNILLGLLNKNKVNNNPYDYKQTVPVIEPTQNEPNPCSKFLELVVVWKKTRDLAVSNNCLKAVEMIDQVFPYLSPVICEEKNESKTTISSK